jgi:hypothetical protein
MDNATRAMKMKTGCPLLRILIIAPPYSILFLPFSKGQLPSLKKRGRGRFLQLIFSLSMLSEAIVVKLDGGQPLDCSIMLNGWKNLL